MILDEHDIINMENVEPMEAQIFQLPSTQRNESPIELDTGPQPYEVAEIARQKLQTLRQQILWDSPTSMQFYLDKLGQAVEQLLGQYHQDHKPKEIP